MKLYRHTILILAAMAEALLWQGCSLVDEDLSDCETDYFIDYELRLVTNMSTELTTELESDVSPDVHRAAATALRAYLRNIFTDFAHDVDLSFYDVVEDSVRLHHEAHVMDAKESSYTLHIPVHKYMHTAVANVADNSQITLEQGEKCHYGKLYQAVADTIKPHNTGLFTARLPMDVQEGESQTFNVRLYMANCATAIVIDTVGSNIRDLKLYAVGFATDFSVCDSLYHFNYTPVVRTDCLDLSVPGGMCFVSVNYPSRDTRPTKTIIETTDPFVSDDASKTLWQLRAYSTLPDGKVTETKLSVIKPLRAGQLKIFKAKAFSNGAVQPDSPDVAASVALDWKAGMEAEIIL